MLVWLGDIAFTLFIVSALYRILMTPMRLSVWRERDEELWTRLCARVIGIEILIAAIVIGLARYFLGVPRWLSLVGL